MSEVPASRRHFLCGATSAAHTLPPWARAFDAFAAACSRCGDCARACPTGVIDASGAYPVVDFARGECTFCGDCVSVCTQPAFDVAAWIADIRPWKHVASIGDECIARARVHCQSCRDECAPGAIRFRPVMGGVSVPQIEAPACTGCGACVRVCPARAITIGASSAPPVVLAGALQ